jgi:hypothetical protein
MKTAVLFSKGMKIATQFSKGMKCLMPFQAAEAPE